MKGGFTMSVAFVKNRQKHETFSLFSNQHWICV